MSDSLPSASISVIVPTIGRPESLARLLNSLAAQTCQVDEVLVADGSDGDEIARLIDQPRWSTELNVRRLHVTPPNAVRQRKAAISEAVGDYLLLLDDDVELEPDCVEQMFKLIESDASVAAVMADFNNQSWSRPTRAWRFYLRYILGLEEGAWQGRVVGPLLRFGFNPVPKSPQPIEWLGAGNSMIRRSAYNQAGGFSDFFLHRCTMNEDVDLGLKLARIGKMYFCPKARMAHYHSPSGRIHPALASEDDLFNRFLVLRITKENSAVKSFCSIGVFFVIETSSHFIGCIRRANFSQFGNHLNGRLAAIRRVILQREVRSFHDK